MKSILSITFVSLAALALAQGAPGSRDPQKTAGKGGKADPGVVAIQERDKQIKQAELDGVQVRLKDIARFRGVRTNQLTGIGLVVGLEGTGDTKKSQATQNVLANLFKDFGTVVDVRTMEAKNVALVLVTCDMPVFAKPGTTLDVRVSSIGDAKSLQGGTLLQTPLYAAGNKEMAYVVAEGALSIGGFNVSGGGGGGNQIQKNHVNVGRIPDGGIVEQSVQTKLVFDGNLYLELFNQDLTTAQRVAQRINDKFPAMLAYAIDGGTIQIRLPEGISPVDAMSQVELLEVFADVPAVVVINERTGTIVVGGNVRLGPAMVAHGALTIRIDTVNEISQPVAPFTLGQTAVVPQTQVNADEEQAQLAVIPPSTTVADLAKIFAALELKPQDIISIMQALKQQGALKARIEIQ